MNRIVPKLETITVDGQLVENVDGDPDSQQTVTVRAGSTIPDINGFLVASESSTNPDGILGRVISRNDQPDGSSTLTLVPARIDEAYAEFELAVTKSLDDAFITPAENSESESPQSRAKPGLSVSAGMAALECSGKTGVTLSISARMDSLRADFRLSLTDKSMKLGLIYSPEFEAELTAEGVTECKLKESYKPRAVIPLTVTPPLSLELRPELTASLKGGMSSSASWSPSVSAGMEYRNGNLGPYADIKGAASLTGVKLSGGAELFAGLSGTAKLAGRIGIGMDVGPQLNIDSITTQCASLAGAAAIKGHVIANAIFVEWKGELGRKLLSPTKLGQYCWNVTSPPTTPPTTTTPTTTTTTTPPHTEPPAESLPSEECKRQISGKDYTALCIVMRQGFPMRFNPPNFLSFIVKNEEMDSADLTSKGAETLKSLGLEIADCEGKTDCELVYGTPTANPGMYPFEFEYTSPTTGHQIVTWYIHIVA